LSEFIADSLGLPRRAVTVAFGDKSCQKFLQIDGLWLADVRQQLVGSGT
jgi:hypothetical protein